MWRSAFHSSDDETRAGPKTDGWMAGWLADRRNTEIRSDDELRGNADLACAISLTSSLVLLPRRFLPFLLFLLPFFFFFFLRCAPRVNDIRRGRRIPNGSPRVFHFSRAFTDALLARTASWIRSRARACSVSADRGRERR